MTTDKRNIVVAVRDEANGPRALRRAMELARPEIDLIHLVSVERMADWARVAQLLQPLWMDGKVEGDSTEETWLEKLTEQARIQGYAAQSHRLSGAPGVVIAKFARDVQADLIIVASPREGLSRELFLGSTALKILRNSDCPVLVARNDPSRAYQSAMLAIDGNPLSQRVIAAAGRFFAAARMDLVNAYLVPEEYKLRMRGVPEATIADLRRAEGEKVESTLRPLAQLAPQATLHVQHGFPPTVLLESFNRLKPDVVVIGKHAGSAADEHVMGSVTQFLLYACNTDFLLVR